MNGSKQTNEKWKIASRCRADFDVQQLCLHHFITLLSLEFKLHGLGNAHYFLGVEVTLTSMGLMLSQHKYVLDILYRAGMSSD